MSRLSDNNIDKNFLFCVQSLAVLFFPVKAYFRRESVAAIPSGNARGLRQSF
jgi:hypothetical protein